MAEKKPGPSAEDHDRPEVDHEHSDVNVRAILYFAAGLAVSVTVVFALVVGLFRYLDTRETRQTTPPHPLAEEARPVPAPGPRIQADPARDLILMREEEAAILGSYGWIDEQAGVVRIPIEEAMRLTVERGLPVRQEPARPLAAPRGSSSGRLVGGER
jgi:hypothetical protein